MIFDRGDDVRLVPGEQAADHRGFSLEIAVVARGGAIENRAGERQALGGAAVGVQPPAEVEGPAAAPAASWALVASCIASISGSSACASSARPISDSRPSRSPTRAEKSDWRIAAMTPIFNVR